MAKAIKAKLGRPTVMTEAVLGKLEQAFAYGSTDKEACFYAGINQDTMYEYQKLHPEFTERKEALKGSLILEARQKVAIDIKNDTKVAQWYLERKVKSEFSLRQELTGKDGDAIQPILVKFLDENDTKDNATDNTHTTGV